jgi:ABC-2 type transport system ATP-binding protein
VKNKVIELLKVKASEGRAIIFTTQIINEAEVLCDKLLILNNGSEVANGSVKDIRCMFDTKNRIGFRFDKLTDLIFDEASLICKLNKYEIPDKCDDSIVFNLSMKNKEEKSTLIQLFERLNPISINAKEPSLEEIFIELVKVGIN